MCFCSKSVFPSNADLHAQSFLTVLKKSVFPNKAYLRQQNLWSLGVLQVDTNSRVARAASGRAWFPLRSTVAQTRYGASSLIRSAASSPDASAEWQSLQTQYGFLAWAALTTRGNVHVRPQGAMCMLCGRPIEKNKNRLHGGRNAGNAALVSIGRHGAMPSGAAISTQTSTLTSSADSRERWTGGKGRTVREGTHAHWFRA